MILQARMSYGGGNRLIVVVYILIILCSTVVGFLYSNNYKNRVSELNEVHRALIQLQNEILYTYTPLPEAIKNVSEKSKYPLNKLFKTIYDALSCNRAESVHEAFKLAINDNRDYLTLKKEDTEVVLDLAKTLGESDLDGHRRIFELAINELKKKIEIAERSMNENVKMYRFLGFSAGTIIVIMLI